MTNSVWYNPKTKLIGVLELHSYLGFKDWILEYTNPFDYPKDVYYFRPRHGLNLSRFGWVYIGLFG